MNLGKTLIGGIIGAAVAIGIYTLLKTQLNKEAVWFPIVIGAFTGLGVRQAHGTLAGNVSYLRGAVSAALAAGAILGCEYFVKWVVTQEGEKSTIAAVEKESKPADDDADDSDKEASEVEAAAPKPVGDLAAGTGDAPKGIKPDQNDMLPFAFMAIGIFAAYQFARGSEAATVGETTEAEPPADPIDDSDDEQANA